MGCPSVSIIPPQHRVDRTRLQVFLVVQSPLFEKCSQLGIVSSFVFFSIHSFNPSGLQKEIADFKSVLFVNLIGAEVIMRLYAFHPAHFVAAGWKRRDVLVLLPTYILGFLTPIFLKFICFTFAWRCSAT